MAKSEKRLLKKAWQETKSLKSEEEFLLKDLFKGYKWNRIPVEKRAHLGRLFQEKVTNKKSIETLNKTKSNQQLYKKVSK